MGNQLFQEARRFVEMAKTANPADRDTAIAKAKNALSSAYANSTIAEQSQLQQMQNELEQVNQNQLD
ncbi:MAG: DUF3813 domain-containing protein [Neobacillus sp.]|jgi:hypothetical protein